jgi:tetratricopeptide (TPR) repeat protein
VNSEIGTERTDSLASVIEQVVARRLAGEEVADAAVITAHPELMPELGENLRRLNLIKEAERLAVCPAEPDLPGDDTDSPAPGGSGMRASDCFAGFRIVRRLHHGGQGVVYQAVESATGRKVAIKVIRQGPLAGRTDRGRFEREVQILQQLDHPRIVSIRDTGVLPGGDIYFVMDYIPGLPLDVFMAGRTLTIEQTLWLFARICEAVHAAHLHGVIHRDLKPGNIRIDPENEPYILDFGLAKLVTPDVSDEAGIAPDPAMTITGQFIGSLPWASPEQAEARHAQVDIRTDVYSLGVILYHMLTGRFPYDVSGGVREILDNILKTAPPPPSRYRQRINNELDTIVLKCLQKDRERRYQSAGELGRDIANYLAHRPIEAKRDSPWYLVRKTLARHRAPVAVAVGIMLITAAAAVVSLTFWQRVLREAQRATQAEKRAESWLGETITARDAARSEARRAQNEAQKSERIVRFLQDTLAAADPRQALGHEVTVREALDAAARRIELGLAGEPQVQAALYATIGKTHQGLGLYELAERYLRRALDVRRAALPADSPDIGSSARDLADLLRDRGRLDDAEKLYREALALQQNDLSADDPQMAATQSGLAQVLLAKSDYPAAEALCRAALAVQTRRLGAEHLDTAETRRRLAAVLFATGDSVAAEPLLREALAVQRKLLGAEHPAVAETANVLAAVRYMRGDLSTAESLYREALATRRALLGEHPAVAETLNDLAVLQRAREQYEEAEALGREALALRRKLLGAAHPDVAESLNNLGLVLLARGDSAGAESLLREALAMYQQAFGSEHAAVARTLNNLAILLAARRDYAAAEPLYREALAIRRRLLGPQHPDVARTLNNLAETLRARGDSAAAEPLCREALEIRRRVLPPGHTELADSLIILAMILIERGDAQAAEPALRECLDIRQQALPAGHWLIADTASVLGSCLATLRQYERAEPLLIESYPVIRAARGDADSRTREALARIVELYTAWGKPEQAAVYADSPARGAAP